MIPYLSLDISRKDWNKAAAFLRSKPYYNASQFKAEACRQVYDLIPYVKSDFASLGNFLDKATVKN